MTPKRIVLEYPFPWINNDVDGSKNSKFFLNVLNVLVKKGLPLSLRCVEFDTYDLPRDINDSDIVFAWHSFVPFVDRGNYKFNVFSLKEAPVSPLFSIDCFGFSGWSSVVDIDKYKEEIDLIQNADEIIGGV